MAVHSFNRYILSTYSVLGTVLGRGHGWALELVFPQSWSWDKKIGMQVIPGNTGRRVRKGSKEMKESNLGLIISVGNQLAIPRGPLEDSIEQALDLPHRRTWRLVIYPLTITHLWLSTTHWAFLAPLWKDEHSSWPKKDFRHRIKNTGRRSLWVSVRWVGARGEEMKHDRGEAAIFGWVCRGRAFLKRWRLSRDLDAVRESCGYPRWRGFVEKHGGYFGWSGIIKGKKG